jgi:hypothetical protein
VEGVSRSPRFAHVYTHPDGGLRRGLLFDTVAAATMGDPNFGGVCPGYQRVGYAVRVPGGWWRIKGQAATS